MSEEIPCTMDARMEQYKDPLNDVVIEEKDIIEDKDFKMKVGKFQIVWTNGLVNFCFLLLFVTFQINACEMFQTHEYRSCSNGLVLFTLATVMELCLIIEPPQLMAWIPFWRNTVGRGIVLCIVSVTSLNGNFLLGLVSLALSFLVVVSPVVTGGTIVAAPIINYEAIFDAPMHGIQASASYGSKSPVQKNKKGLGESYQSIPSEE